jgi:hypothetical protein
VAQGKATKKIIGGLAVLLPCIGPAGAVTYQCENPRETPIAFNLTTFRFYDAGVRGRVELLGNGGLVPVYPGEEGRDGPIYNIGVLERVLRERPKVIDKVDVYSDSRFRFRTRCIRL